MLVSQVQRARMIRDASFEEAHWFFHSTPLLIKGPILKSRSREHVSLKLRFLGQSLQAAERLYCPVEYGQRLFPPAAKDSLWPQRPSNPNPFH